MVASDRNKKKKPVDKKTLFSLILIALATIGFTFLNYYIEPKINKLKDDKSKYIERQMMSFDFINKSNYNIEVYYILSDHYRIVKLLDSRNKILLDSIEYNKFQVLGSAAHNALNSAVASEQIDRKDNDSLSMEIVSLTDSLKSEKELSEKKLIKEKLSDIYFDYNKKGGKGTENLQEIIDEINKNISKYLAIKSISWPIFLFFQTLGFLLAIWSNLYRR
jgi:hypothetical protein